MKIIWTILLTMVLFNGFLFTFSMFFVYPVSTYDSTNITGNSSFDQYKTPGESGFSLVEGIIGNVASIFEVIIGFVVTLATKNLKYFAAGVMAGVITSLWISTAMVFTNILNGNVVMLGIYGLISIAIGIIVVIIILGIFTEQEQMTQ